MCILIIEDSSPSIAILRWLLLNLQIIKSYVWFTKTKYDIGNNIIFSDLIDEILNLYSDFLIKNELKRNYIYYTCESIHMNDSYVNRKLCYQFVDLKQWCHSRAILQIPLFIR